MDPVILETMNDIIDKIDRREWLRVNEHRDRLVKKMRKQSQKIEEMKDDWEIATEKIAQDCSRGHNEIKRLKDEIRKYENRWKMFNVENELEIKLLTAEHGSEEIRNCMKENEELKEKLQLFERLRDQDTYSIKRLEKLNREVKCSRCAPWRG